MLYVGQGQGLARGQRPHLLSFFRPRRKVGAGARSNSRWNATIPFHAHAQRYIALSLPLSGARTWSFGAWRRGEERRGSPLPALEELWTNQTTKGVITMAEKKITVNAVSIAQSKCYKETRLPIGFEVMKNTGTSYKIRITCGDPAVRWEGGPHYLFGKQLFTTREAKAMFDMIRMMRQLNWMKPAGEAPIASILSAEYHDGAWCLNELNIPD